MVDDNVYTFPCHWTNENKIQVSKEIQSQRCQKGIDALKRYGVIHPKHKFNAGCDLVFVHDFDSSGIGIHFFETKYYTNSSSEESQSSHVLKWSLSTNEASNKACLVLNALVDDGDIQPLGDCEVKTVSFTLCVTNGTTANFDLSYKGAKQKYTILQCIDCLKAKGITVSLHIISEKSHWISILTPPLHYALPDVDEPTGKAKAIKDL